MTRRELREKTFILLFRADFHEIEDMPEQMMLYFDTNEKTIEEEDRQYVEQKIQAILDHKEELDKAIADVSQGWDLDRIDKVSLTIMRLAYYEIRFDETIPDKVSINEAVELAKKFGQDDSPAFVNGILGKLIPS